MPKPDLMAMPIHQACHRRWEAGRKLYGGPRFQGDPAQELYEELIDSLNYLCEMKEQGLDVKDWGQRLLDVTHEVKAAHASRLAHMTAGGA